MRIIFLFSMLLVTLIGVTKSTDKIYNYSTCFMPCHQSMSCPSPSLMKTFSHSVGSYTITAILGGCEGYFEILVSHNATDYRYFSSKIYVKYWTFVTLCGILGETPVIIPIENDTSRLSVHFPSFRLIQTHLQSREDFLTYMLFENVGSLHSKLCKVQDELNSLKEKCLERLEMQARLKYAIYNASVTGNTWHCQHPNPLKYPTYDRYCAINGGNWVTFDLMEIFKVNIILFRLWDQDARVYTYNLSISPDGINWRSIAVGKAGKSDQVLKLDEVMEVRFIKMEGRNTVNIHLAFNSFTVDWI